MSKRMKRAFLIEAGSPFFNSSAIWDMGLGCALASASLAALIASFEIATLDCASEEGAGGKSLDDEASEAELLPLAAYRKILLKVP